MASWGRWASRLTRSASRRLESARTGVFGERLARQVVPYRGFGSDTEVFVSGRVLANRPARPVTETDAWWRNLAHALHHLESDEVTGADVRIRAFGAERSVLTDDEGYFRTWLRPAQALIPDGAWHDVAVEVTHPVHPDAGRVQAAGRILLPGSNAEYGIISDLDDTVIRTEATRLLRMLKRTLLENARTRLPFPGVTAFYAALRDGAAGDAGNPVFYVSSSPWNLYGLLTDFLDHQSIPDGPLMLRDWGINAASGLPTRHGAHKRDAIRMIMRCYPGLPFILIGDSGQEDPEVYRDVVHDEGGRILAVYIRDVGPDPHRSTAIGELAEEVRSAGSELLLSDDTAASARHAAGRGWISGDSVTKVTEAVRSSGASPG
jgi:phosphatidate phosphatase APP1